VAKALRAWEKYAQGVLRGRIVVGKYHRMFVERHMRDLKEGPKRGLHFDVAAAERVIRFFSFLHHSKGEWAGTPIILEAWQQFLLAVIFGWKREDGARRFRESYNEIARKNGKSTIAAGVGIYCLVADKEPGAEVYAAATKKDQAKIVHEEAERMVKASPGLRQRIGIVKNNLHLPNTASKFEPLGADEDTMDGLNAHAIIIDEFHAHKTRGVYDVLRTATGSRRQPLMFIITTAGYDRQSVCYELHEYTIKVLTGAVEDDSFCGFICAIDEKTSVNGVEEPGDDWKNPACWVKANPNLGVSVKREALESQAMKAQQLPAEQNSFRRLRLNQWTEQSTKWIDDALWTRNGAVVESHQLRGRRCFAGLDMSSTTDVSAFVLLFPPTEDDPLWAVHPYFWIPEENMKERMKRDRVPFDAWVRDGLVKATEGNVVDYNVVRDDIHEALDEFELVELAYDRWNTTQLVTQLTDDGILCVPFGQGYQSMSAPTKELEKLLLAGSIAHGGNPVLKWMASNVAVKVDAAENKKPDKEKARQRIDGIVALIMALGRAMLVSGEGSSVYDSRGVRTL
jgi:phage terminase large subunit-like protein